MVLFHSNEKDEDRDECLDRIGPSAQSHVGASNLGSGCNEETHVVVRGDVTSRDTGHKGAAVELDVLHGLQRDWG